MARFQRKCSPQVNIARGSFGRDDKSECIYDKILCELGKARTPSQPKNLGADMAAPHFSSFRFGCREMQISDLQSLITVFAVFTTIVMLCN